MDLMLFETHRKGYCIEGWIDGSLAISVLIWEEDMGTPNGPKVCKQLCPNFGSEAACNCPIHTIH